MAASQAVDPKPRGVSRLDQQEYADAWENTITKLGRARDKRTGGRVIPPLRQHSRQEFDDLYHGDDIASTLANLPAQEMVREWITLNVDDSRGADDEGSRSEKPAADLLARLSVPAQMEQEAQRLDLQSKTFESTVWSRVHGGSLMFIGADDGLGGDPENLKEPLDEGRIETIKFLEVFDRWDVRPLNDRGGRPEFYNLLPTVVHHGGLQSMGVGFENQIHASRFIRFDGVLTSKFRQRQNNGWSDSIYVRLKTLIRDYNLSWDGVFHLISDFAQAVFKMRGLADAMASDNDNLVVDRAIIMDQCRSIARAILIDAEEEDFERKVTPVSGLPDLLDRGALRLSTAGRIPVSLLLGQSPAGLNATGDSDISFFYDQIRAVQNTYLRPKLQRLYTLMFLAKDSPTKGMLPENWSFEFNPLWQLDAKEKAELRKTQAETDEIYIMNDVVDPEEITASRFAGDTYSPETTLDTKKRAEQKANPEPEPTPPPAPPPPAFPAPRVDQDNDGVCDPASPNYDVGECAKRRARGDGTRVVATSVDAGHSHFAEVDFLGNGVAYYNAARGGEPHQHPVRNWEVGDANGHIHTIEKPADAT